MNKRIISLVFVISTIAIQSLADTTSRKLDQPIQEHPAQRKASGNQTKSTNADVEVTRRIRDRLTSMDDLSVRAQNVTIVTKGNNVTVKGDVDKEQEIPIIMGVAQESAQGKNISNQLRIHK